MVGGYDHDDRYRMVEDEFLTSARTFTAHLHAAEYQRLKVRAKSQNASTIENISRPVTTATTDVVRLRHEKDKRKKNLQRTLKAAMANDDDTSDEDDPSWMGTALQGLMASARKKDVPLRSVTSSHPETKAGSGSIEGSPRKRARLKLDTSVDARDDPHESGGTFEGTIKSRVSTNGLDDHDGDLDGLTTSIARAPSLVQVPPRQNLIPVHIPVAHRQGASAERLDGADTLELGKHISSGTAEYSDEEEPFRQVRERRAKRKAAGAEVRKRATVKKEGEHQNLDVVPSFL